MAQARNANQQWEMTYGMPVDIGKGSAWIDQSYGGLIPGGSASPGSPSLPAGGAPPATGTPGSPFKDPRLERATALASAFSAVIRNRQSPQGRGTNMASMLSSMMFPSLLG